MNYVYANFGANEQLKHKAIIQKLMQIIANKALQRVATRQPQRVPAPSTSVDITAPETIRTSKRIHQRQKRINIPMQFIINTVVDAGRVPFNSPLTISGANASKNQVNARQKHQTITYCGSPIRSLS